jgi:hypothetical protein
VDPGADLQQVRKILGQPQQQKVEPESVWNNRAWELENLLHLPVPDQSAINHGEK